MLTSTACFSRQTSSVTLNDTVDLRFTIYEFDVRIFAAVVLQMDVMSDGIRLSANRFACIMSSGQ